MKRLLLLPVMVLTAWSQASQSDLNLAAKAPLASATLTGNVGVGGANAGAQAPFEIFNNSVALSESASLTSTRLIELSDNVATVNHRVVDAGFHADLNSYSLAYAEGTYGGLYVEDSVGGGTLTYGGGLKGYVQTDSSVAVTEVNGVRSDGAVSGTSQVGAWYSFRGQIASVVGTVTNYHGVFIADVSATEFTAAFNSAVNSGTGKWGVYAGGTARNYLRGTTLIGNSTDRSNGVLQLPADTTSSTAGIGFGSDVSLYRSAANTLRTDDTLQAGGDVVIDTGSELKLGTGGVRGKFGASADGVFYLRNSDSTSPGLLRSGRNVQGKTSSYTLTAIEAGDETWHNAGAGGTVTFTLPTGVSGMMARFVVLTAQPLRVATGTSTQIRQAAALTTATTGYLESSAVGDVVQVQFLGGYWVVVSVVGTWTVN